MVYHLAHDMLARQNAEDAARARFVLALKRQVAGPLRSANGLAYQTQGEPAFEAVRGAAPANRAEALEAFGMSRFWRYWSAINRSSQELMWTAVAEPIYRDQPRLEAEAQQRMAAPTRKGSLHLDPAFEPDPAYTGVGIHLQPHSYVPEDPDGKDVLAGAYYEMGGRLYSMGQGLAARDSKAGAVLSFLAQERPGWAPRRVLDMGCSAGGASVVYAEDFPEAEVHAIDLGSSMLRYAHARAECLGHPVHFHQMDAARTSFPGEHFDLVVSHNLLHEISSDGRRAMARETRRLLAPGGIAVHQDIDLLFIGKTLWQEAERAWDQYHNHELFWLDYAECDFPKELAEAGFPAERVRAIQLPRSGLGKWQVFLAEAGA